METVMIWDLVKGITSPTPKVEETTRATQQRFLLTGENREVEDDPLWPKEFLSWESKESHVSITGDPRIRIHFKYTHPKLNPTIARGGLLHQGQTASLISSISHPPTVLHKDSRVTGAHLSTVTLQVTHHLPQDISVATQLTEDQVLDLPFMDLSEAPKSSQVFHIKSSGVETLERITV